MSLNLKYLLAFFLLLLLDVRSVRPPCFGLSTTYSSDLLSNPATRRARDLPSILHRPPLQGIPSFHRSFQGNDALSLLDILSSFAVLVSQSSMPWSRPKFNTGNVLPSLSSHSLDDRIQAELAFLLSPLSILDPLAASDSVIPNDLLLTAFTPHQLVLGPNCSGKTTFIKQIGVACVLAQLGCFVPAQYGHVPVFDSLAMCGGEEESIESGLSSFAREVRSIRDVFDGLSGCSLLLCDEFGKG